MAEQNSKPWIPIIGMVLVLSAGCGVMENSRSSAPSEFPPSHSEIAGMAVFQAFGDAGIPAGSAQTVYRLESASAHRELMLPVAREFLLSHQYRLIDRNSDDPVISITIDTLTVTLNTADRGLVQRRAVSGLTVSIPGSDGTRAVFRGMGTSEDFFASDLLQTLDGSQSYVVNRIPEGRLMRRIQPVLIAITMTILGWMLYSYRG